MENKLYQALLAHYNSQLLKAEANLLVYFKNPSGVGEHSDLVLEMTTLVDKVALSKTAIDVLNQLVATPEPAPVEADQPAAEEVN